MRALADPRRSADPRRCVLIIGGGISGLAAAWQLHRHHPHLRFVLCEGSSRWGGSLRSERTGPYVFECGADSALHSAALPEFPQLVEELGLADQRILLLPDRRRAYLVRRAKLYPVPEGFYLMAPPSPWGAARASILGWPGRARLAAEWLVPARRDPSTPSETNAILEDESLASFARRRVGEEAYRWLVQPLVGGIHSADPERLSIRAALPQFWEAERRHGGLIRGLRANPLFASAATSGPRYDMFMSLRGGMGSLVDALVARLPTDSMRSGYAIDRVFRRPDGLWEGRSSRSAEPPFVGEGLILAIPSAAAANLLSGFAPGLAAVLRHLQTTSVAVAQFAVRTADLGQVPPGMGIVVPAAEGMRILAISFSSHKFPDRCPPNETLLRVFLGGAMRAESMRRDDESLLSIAWEEAGSLLKARGRPTTRRLDRWIGSTPQYHVGHLDRLRRIEAYTRDIPTLALAGNAYQGIGVPQCIRSGRFAADRIAAALSSPSL